MAEANVSGDWKFWVVIVLGVVCLTLVAANIALESRMHERQAEVAARQQFINESQALSRLHNQIVQALATLSAQSNDDAIRDMLARHGVTFTVNASGQADVAGDSGGGVSP